jgi:tRNA threonylcarbamoyladenosine biosynthesis protein TsaB
MSSRVVAFETSTRSVSVALLDGEDCFEEHVPAGGGRGSALLPLLEGLLQSRRLDVRNIDVFAAGVGPGSYTGIRIGLTLASSLAFASGRALVGVDSLEVLAHSAGELDPVRPLAVVGNAFRGEVMLAAFGTAPRRRSGENLLFDPLQAAAQLSPGHLVVGEGAEAYPEAFAAAGHEVVAGVRPSARVLARLALTELVRRGADDPLSISPVHLRSVQEEFRTR